MVLGQVGHKIVNPPLELCPRDFHARPEVIILLGPSHFRGADFPVLIFCTYFAEVRNISVEILFVFFDDQVTSIFDLLAVVPLDRAVSKLEKDGVVAIPSLEIYGQPCPALGVPKGPSAIKVQAARAEQS